jgi:thiamine kinase-like enzyme
MKFMMKYGIRILSLKRKLEIGNSDGKQTTLHQLRQLPFVIGSCTGMNIVSRVVSLTSKNKSTIKKLSTDIKSTKMSSLNQRHRPTKYLSNSNLSLGIKVEVKSSERDNQILQVTKVLCPHLEEEDQSGTKERDIEFSVKPLTGGLSNELFIVTRVSSPTSSVLLRIHADESGEDGMVNRDVENHLAAWLSDKGIAPIYYGRFDNGRIEEFYENVLPLTSSAMAAFGPKIGESMAIFHSLAPSADIIPKPSIYEADRYEAVDDWLRKAFQLEEDQPNNNMELLKRIETEWKWLFSELQETNDTDDIEMQALEFIRQVVLTHMDCQSLNILKNDSDDIRVIDFEYAGWNSRALDISNTFCEYCDMNNICADYEKEYPSDEQQNDFLVPYVRRAHPDLAEQLDTTNQWVCFLKYVRHEVGRFSLVSHLGWAIWSVIKSKEDSSIDFDYIKYGLHRIDGYKFAKNKFFDGKESSGRI